MVSALSVVRVMVTGTTLSTEVFFFTPIALAVNKSPAVFISMRALSEL